MGLFRCDVTYSLSLKIMFFNDLLAKLLISKSVGTYNLCTELLRKHPVGTYNLCTEILRKHPMDLQMPCS